VSYEAGVGVAMDVGLPLPACRVGVASAYVFGLETLEFLLGAEFVGLIERRLVYVIIEGGLGHCRVVTNHFVSLLEGLKKGVIWMLS
jgi:hypothetical protein